MAKARDIAALAGLAGLAYAYNKNKGKPNEDAGDQKTSSYTKDTKKVEASDEPRRKIEDYQKKAPEAEDANYGNEGRRTSMGVAPASKSASKPVSKSKPELKSFTTRKDPREAEAGMSRGTRGADASKAYPSGVMGGARQADTGSKVADTVKTVAKTVARGPIGVAADATKPLADKATNAMRETYRDLSGKVRYKEPSGPSAAQTVGDAVASGAKKVGSGISDYVKNFETPAERRSREAKEAKNAPAKAPVTRSVRDQEMEREVLNNMITNPPMKKGGMVKKMASGGMTASRRADGIASRGKTRCKMY